MRDWLYVEDHADALLTVLANAARSGAATTSAARTRRGTSTSCARICALLDEMRPAGAPHDRLITFVTDRPGHDARYAIDPTRIRDGTGLAARR